MRTQSKIDTTKIVWITTQFNWWETRQATSDWIITARANWASSGTTNTTWVKISTWDTTSLTFRVWDWFVGNPQTLFASATYPIKKWEYYKVDTYSSNWSSYFQAFFTPLV